MCNKTFSWCLLPLEEKKPTELNNTKQCTPTHWGSNLQRNLGQSDQLDLVEKALLSERESEQQERFYWKNKSPLKHTYRINQKYQNIKHMRSMSRSAV